MTTYTFTSESVTEGHPDKMADQISDAVLDAILAEDPNGRVACETLLTTGLCVVAGEITTDAYVDIPKLARETINGIGYDNALYGFDGNTCGVIVVDRRAEPRHRPGRRHQRRGPRRSRRRGPAQRPGRRRPGDDVRLRLRRDPRPDAAADLDWPTAWPSASPRCASPAQVPYLRPDGKTQVTFEYEDGKPVAPARRVLICTQHQDGIDRDTVIRPDLIEQVIRPIDPRAVRRRRLRRLRQPDRQRSCSAARTPTAGLTGRKIIVDTYGGMGRHGGGAFSGKDPTKVDRSAAYAGALGRQARGGQRRRRPLRGAGGLRHRHGPPDEHPRRDVRHRHGRPRHRSRRPCATSSTCVPAPIVRDLDLKRPIYRQTAAYGHFGRARLPVGGTRSPRRLHARRRRLNCPERD